MLLKAWLPCPLQCKEKVIWKAGFYVGTENQPKNVLFSKQFLGGQVKNHVFKCGVVHDGQGPMRLLHKGCQEFPEFGSMHVQNA